MNEKTVYILQDYIEQNCSTAKKFPTKAGFKRACFRKWAAYEILERCEEELLKPPPHISGQTLKTVTEIIKEFKDMMANCYNYAGKDRYMFVIARNTANDILDYLTVNNYI